MLLLFLLHLYFEVDWALNFTHKLVRPDLKVQVIVDFCRNF